jgi:glycosyltransferase involved in cell wall biosynthesis
MSVRFAFYMPHLRTGGAERVTVNLANHFVARGERPLMLLDRRDGALIDALMPGVEVVSLDAPRTLLALPRLRRVLRDRHPAVLLSGITYNSPIAILAAGLAGGRTRVAVAEHTVLSHELDERGPRDRAVVPRLLQLAYRHAAAILCPTEAIAADLARLCGIPRRRIEVLPNPVIGPDTAARAARPTGDVWLVGPDPVFVAAGRMTPVKDFSTLLAAFARVAAHRSARLILLGDGPLREALTHEAASLGVADRVRLPGAVADPLPWFARAAAVVSSSRYEGFGNVLVEALACGTPVVSTDCPGGPRSILDGGRYGRLVPVGDAPALAAAMLEVLDRRPDAALLRQGAERYTIERAGDQYLERLGALAVRA